MSTPNDISTLIPIRDNDGQQVASGRDLHAYLGIGTRYDQWFDRMIGYGFTEDLDYTVISDRVPSEAGNRTYTQTDHAVTIDMAKELGMIQRTEKGKELRQYFIEVEKRFREQSNVVALPSRAALAQMVLDAEKELGEAQSTIESQKPIVSYHDRFVAERDDIITVDNFASQYGSTGPKVRELLKSKGVAVRRPIGSRWSDTAGGMVEQYEWRPRQGAQSSDWFEVRPQHNAPRLHNGQVRQTMYVLQYHAESLAVKLGLTQPEMFTGGEAA